MSVCVLCRPPPVFRASRLPPSLTTWMSTTPIPSGSRGAKMWVEKRIKIKNRVAPGTVGPLSDALRMLKAWKPLDHNLAIQLNIEPILKKGVNTNAVKGRVFLPHNAKDSDAPQESIAVICPDGPDNKLAVSMGADYVGEGDLVTQIVRGDIKVDKLVAHPASLKHLTTGSVARVLGPLGLMPSERRGTVSTDLAAMIRDARGALDWSLDEDGMVRVVLGRVGMELEKVEENMQALVDMVGDVAVGGAGSVRPYVPRRSLIKAGVKKSVVEAGGMSITAI